MDTKSLSIGLVVGILIGVFGYYVLGGLVKNEEISSSVDTNEPGEILFSGFENEPDAVKGIQETVRKDNENEGRIGPGSYIRSVQLVSSEKIVWPNDCLTFWTETMPSSCVGGVYPGYDVFVSVDGELQHWKVSEDQKFGSIGVGLGMYKSFSL
ncbi:hypothetical protein IPJ70_02905 [Candidatus Campbellbacteria bacterium]|nr:MAG: hypothetical protein IPJ70_02905 [Candidatus Campbellbacteria bacterium]